MPGKSKSDKYLFNAPDTIRLLNNLKDTHFDAWASTATSTEIAASVNTSMLRDPDYPTQTWALNPSNPDQPSWLQATLAEIKTLIDAGAITAIRKDQIPTSTSVLRSLIVFRRKRDSEGLPIKDKARLVCDGSSAPYEGPTFSPTCRLSTIKLLSAFATHNRTLQHQMDITAAYVQAPIHRPNVFMSTPRGLDLYDDDGHPLALHIHKSLYGHPLSGKNWWTMISTWAKENGFQFSPGDPCLWTLRHADKWICLSIFVDDLTACSNDSTFFISKFINPLTSAFPARYEGPATWTLGTCIDQSRAQPTKTNYNNITPNDLKPTTTSTTFTTSVSTKQKLRDLLTLTNMTNCNPAKVPMVGGMDKRLCAKPKRTPPTTKTGSARGGSPSAEYPVTSELPPQNSPSARGDSPSAETSEGSFPVTSVTSTHSPASLPSRSPTSSSSSSTSTDDIALAQLELTFQYAHTVAALSFIARAARPDFVFTANLLARFMGNPQRIHYDALRQLLRYIKGTIDLEIRYDADADDTIRHYCDASHQDDVDTRHSTLGYVTTWKGAAIDYHSRKSDRVADSSAESELYGLHHATKKVLALAKDLRHLHIIDNNASITISVDNEATCTNVNNRYQFGRMRHIDAAFMMVHERVAHNEINLTHVAGTDNPADLFTKALPEATFLKHRHTIMGAQS